MPKQSVEGLTSKYLYQEIYQYKGKPITNGVTIKYIKALLDVAGSDGVLTDAEKKWVLGYAAARGRLIDGLKNEFHRMNLGLTVQELDALKDYKVGSENSTANFNNNSKLKLAEHFQSELIYDGFRAAAADGPLKPREVESISAVAKYLGMSDDKFQAILAIYKEEEELRQKRIAFLFPKPYGETIKLIDTHYGR